MAKYKTPTEFTFKNLDLGINETIETAIDRTTVSGSFSYVALTHAPEILISMGNIDLAKNNLVTGAKVSVTPVDDEKTNFKLVVLEVPEKVAAPTKERTSGHGATRDFDVIR
jgi:hypothetical protein